MKRSTASGWPTAVVPRKGDVDRNATWAVPSTSCRVVPRKGDVDRNLGHGDRRVSFGGSSPARGTWIEICRSRHLCRLVPSSPARGTWIEIIKPTQRRRARTSSPARGTWIEIRSCRPIRIRHRVVPRKGDVDRNRLAATATVNDQRRPPQGGRG